MGDYLRPDVYVEEVASGEKPVQAVSTSTGAFIGLTARGEVGKPILVTSWSDFVKKFALGLETPFIKDSHLPNAVFGFFQNGGSKCYVVRVASATATEGKIVAGVDGVEFKAKEVGTWCNGKISLKVTQGVGETFTLSVYANKELVEVIEGLSNKAESPNYFPIVINETSNFVKVAEPNSKSLAITESNLVLTGGTDALDSLADGDFSKGLTALDSVRDVNLVAIPGKTESTLVAELVTYCDTRNDCFAIVDAPENATDEEVRTFREKLNGTNGALYHPWGKIVDPIGRTAKALKNCPPSGHVMGVYARTDSTRGAYKAPAGEECIVRGFVDLTTVVTDTQQEILNPLGVNVIVAKPNKGIMIWGARTLSADPSKKYVSDVRYNLMLKKSLYEGTQWAVFEPNNEILWNRLDTSLRGFLDEQWKQGALRGATAEQAYYVKCDSELNDQTSIDLGKIVSEIGYAKQRPAEFVVIRIVQKTNE